MFFPEICKYWRHFLECKITNDRFSVCSVTVSTEICGLVFASVSGLCVRHYPCHPHHQYPVSTLCPVWPLLCACYQNCQCWLSWRLSRFLCRNVSDVFLTSVPVPVLNSLCVCIASTPSLGLFEQITWFFSVYVCYLVQISHIKGVSEKKDLRGKTVWTWVGGKNVETGQMCIISCFVICPGQRAIVQGWQNDGRLYGRCIWHAGGESKLNKTDCRREYNIKLEHID
jgi:hypothetical protein